MSRRGDDDSGVSVHRYLVPHPEVRAHPNGQDMQGEEIRKSKK